ncbi:MAG: Ig-like domain-containing protein, partial [Desulfurococcaceae archaeon]
MTLVVADDYSPYEFASIWNNRTLNDYKVITDFRAIGITGMRSIYRNLALKYLNETKKALDCPRLEKADYAKAINAYALAAMAGFIANASTDRYAAIFTLTSQQPKDTVDVCKMTVDQVGSAEIARLFMKGQRLRFVVWYMGQKVFDDYVTITGPLVKINADVYPVNVTTYTKSMRLPVDAFVGFTITDVYLGLALNKTNARFSNATLVPQLTAPFSNTFKTYGLSKLLVNELASGTAAAFNSKVEVLVGGKPVDEYYFGQYRDVLTGGSFVYLPNLAVIRNGTVPRYLYTILTSATPVTKVDRVHEDTVIDKSFDILPNNVVVITLRGARIWSDPARNATYVGFISYNGTDPNGQRVEPQLIVDASDAVISVGGRVRQNEVWTVNANHTIELIVNAKCGSVTIMPGVDELTINLEVVAGTCDATVRYIATNRTYTVRNVTAAYPSMEYAVSFDRWFAVPYDWRYRAFNVLYHSINVVNRSDVLRTLSHVGNTTKCATLQEQIIHDEDDEYRYRLMLRGVEVVNYRTLEVELPWKVTGGKALVNITAYFANGTKIDSIVYNLTDMLAGTRSTRAVVRLPLNFGRVGALAYRIATQNLEVRYDITFYMYDPTTAPTRVCATKLVPLVAEYATVSMYDCMEMRPGAPEIDPQTTVYRINIAQSLANAFGETFDKYGGFGTPITYVVKAGDIALLPSWYHKTSVAGSRIARIWIIAAGEQPCGTPALGTRYSFTEVKDDKVELKLYKFNKYLVVNFVPNVCPAGVTTRTYLDEFDGEGRIVGLGFGTSGTSALVISNYTGVQMWNSTAMWLAGGAFKLPTVALDRLTVKNEAEFPIVVGALTVRYMDRCTYKVPVDLTYVGSKTVNTTLLDGYGFGRTYMMNITDVWAFRLVQPNYRYSLKVYHAGVVDAVKYFGLDGGLDMAKILNHVSPLTTAEFVQNVLYASHAPAAEWTYTILFGKIREVTRGTWSDLVVNSSDWDYKYVFSFPTLRLREIRDWNDRPLANQTVVLFAGGKPYAIVYTDSSGRLVYPLPDLRDPSQIVRVSWYYGYLFELLRGRPEFTIWIYDQSIERDRVELGVGTVVDKIRTYVYPLTVTVRDAAGRPLTNMIVQVIDTSTTGRLVNAANKTGADGGAQVVDLRISKYATGVLSQVPATSYIYRVFDENGALVAEGRFEIQRGAAVPAQGWNIIATVQYITEIPVRNSATRGYLLIRNVEFIDGSRRDVKVPFTISNGVMRLQGKVPVTVDYPVEIYITHVTLGNVEVSVRGGERLVFTGRTGDLLTGLDFAELGVTGIVTIQAVDSSQVPRPDWTVQVLYNDTIVAQGAGQVQVVLPRTDLLDAPYNVRVITNAITPAGTALVKEQTFEVRQRSQSLQIPVSTVKVTILAVDGFNSLRSDW